MPRILVLGYFGAGNLGDDALLASWVVSQQQFLCDREIRLAVVSRNPRPLAGFIESDSIERMVEATFSPLEALKLVPHNYAGLIAPGGSLLQDSTSWGSLALYLGIIQRFHSSARGVFLLNQGLGPLKRQISRLAVGSVLAWARMLSWRDPDSFELARSLPALSSRHDMKESCDAALLSNLELDSRGVLKAAGMARTYLVVVPKGEVISLGAAVAGIASTHKLKVQILPFHPDQDTQMAGLIARQCGGEVLQFAGSEQTSPVNSMKLGVLANAALVVSVRLHGLILAAASGVPAVGLGYDPKVVAFCHLAGYPCLPLSASQEDLQAAAEPLLAGDGWPGRLQLKCNRLRAKYAKSTSCFEELWDAL